MSHRDTELFWTLIGRRLGKLLGEASDAGFLSETSAPFALAGLKEGLREHGTKGALSILEQIDDWSVQDVMDIRDGIVPGAWEPNDKGDQP